MWRSTWMTRRRAAREPTVCTVATSWSRIDLRTSARSGGPGGNDELLDGAVAALEFVVVDTYALEGLLLGKGRGFEPRSTVSPKEGLRTTTSPTTSATGSRNSGRRNEAAHGPGPVSARATGSDHDPQVHTQDEHELTDLDPRLVGGLVVAAAALPAMPAAARTSPAQTPGRLRRHLLGESSSLRAAAAAAGARLEPCEQAGQDGLGGNVDVPLDRAHPARGTCRSSSSIPPTATQLRRARRSWLPGAGPASRLQATPG
jgi:hypothetical protein